MSVPGLHNFIFCKTLNELFDLHIRRLRYFVGKVQYHTYDVTRVDILVCDSSYVLLTNVLDNHYM